MNDMAAPREGLIFKRLTSKNWRTRDPTARHIVRVRNGKISSLSGGEWAEIFLTPQLSSHVPIDLVELFEVARGALCYGYFFYPMYTLGSEQLYRVLDAALARRCAQLGAPKRLKQFAKRVTWMHKNRVIDDFRKAQWEGARGLRNLSSHAERQSIHDPMMAATDMDIAVELIGELFDGAGLTPRFGDQAETTQPAGMLTIPELDPREFARGFARQRAA